MPAARPVTSTPRRANPAGAARRALAAGALLLLAGLAYGADVVDPALRFRTITTEHFAIHFHQGEDEAAARLATIAEETWRALRVPSGASPPHHTEVVFVDDTELANGSATPVPYDTVFVTAAWPAGSEFIGNTDDWLRLVFTHEFAHIVHLDRSKGWARLLRGIFGRTPIAFPNVFLPEWQIEGLATYEESVLTGQGRLYAGDFRAVVDEAARARALEPLDRVNGGVVDWPGGVSPYAYGLGFHAYLAARFGAASLATLADATSGRVPYTSSRVFRRIFGESLGELWRDYEAALVSAGSGTGERLDSRRLTHHGFTVLGPRFTPPSCPNCPAEVVYSARTPDGFPTLNMIALDGSPPRRIATRYLGSTVGVSADTIVFDQQELRRNAGLYSDLYAFDRSRGRVRRLTTEGRLMDPDLSPDGRTIVAVRNAADRRDLVLIALGSAARPADAALRADPAHSALPASAAITVLQSEPETWFNAPRWSPDGRSVAVERHRRNALPEIAIVDVGARTARVVGAVAGARVVSPTWRPDGRAIVAAADPNGEPFNLYEFAVDRAVAPRQLTHTTGGATWPDVSGDGRSIAFVGYTVAGFDVFVMPYPRDPSESDTPAMAITPPSSPIAPAVSDSRGASGTGAPHPYSPLPTLRPTSWAPILTADSSQVRFGVATGGSDVLRYHGYGASATWLVSHPGGAVAPSASTPDWSVGYAYDRWRPALWATASSSTSFFAGPATESGAPSAATLRERSVEAGVVIPVVHVRTSHTTWLSLAGASDDFTLPDRSLTRTRAAARAAWSVTSARTYGYSISQEDGGTFAATAELVRRALGASDDATAITADARLYATIFAPHHVLAVRVAGAASTGDRTLGRTFHLGGAASNASGIDFGSGVMSLMRGFPADTFAGSRAALVNADYRWPLARPQRGFGTWPFLLRTIHAAALADAGHVWDHSFRLSDAQFSGGGELAADIVVGYAFPLTVAVGVARGHDGSHTVPDRTTVYVRVGRAF